MNSTNTEVDKDRGFIDQQEVYKMWVKCRPLWKKWAYQMGYVDYEREDWEQHSYLVCMRAMETYKSHCGIGFTAYYRMILYREGKNTMKKYREYSCYEGQIEELYEEYAQLLEDESIEREWISRLNRALEILGMDDKEVIIRYYIFDESMQSIADRMGVTYKMIEYKKRRGLKHLRNFFEKN